MSLSKYPEKLDLFQVKKDAAFDGDPNGDDVMADDINSLQDSISAIQETLGLNPQGSKTSVGERISLLEGSSAMRVPSFLIYLGEVDKINGATTVDQATGHFVKFDHIVFGNNAEETTSESHAITENIIGIIKKNREIHVYGYIDSGVNTTNLSVAEIQVKIQSWKDMGADGIYLDNFGYESGVSRDRQNQILDSIHQYGMVAIMQSGDAEKLLTDAYDETMNPNWVAPHIEPGDVYHYQQFAIDTTTPEVYTDAYGIAQKILPIYHHRWDLGVRIFATPYIASNTDPELAQTYYNWAHTGALLTSVDAFYPVTEGYAKLNNEVRFYNWMPIAGNWYMNRPIIDIDTATNTFSRETAFGKIIMNNSDHTYKYEGMYIPFDLLQIIENTIAGTLLQDGTVEDKKIKNYDGQRLIDSINTSTGDTIDISRISTFDYGDINGNIPTDVLKANVIEAINAYIGTARIDEAYIGDLHASKITAGTIDAERITASVVDALNLYAQNATIGSAVIDQAVIGDLSADKITAGDIDAERITAGVIDAINLSAKQGYIQNLNADNITAGNIKADRIKADVINAINLYAQNMQVGDATINTATIGALSAGHIEAAVIDAINMNADTATIKAAKIGSLDVDNIKASVISAINASIENAVIDQAQIGNLDATKITAGTIDADRLKASIIDAINLTTQTATIDQAKIGDLSADKITAGDISTDRLQANIVNAINAYAQNMVADSAKIDIASIGDLDAQHIKGAVIEAINLSSENATIGNAKIGTLSVDNMKASVIAAVNASLETASIDQAKIGNLDATKITTGDLNADRIKAGVISAINASLDTATIGAAKIGSLEVGNMQASVIAAVNASIENATINAAKIGTLSVDNMKANIVDAINLYAGTAKIDNAHISALDADHISAAVIEAINANIGSATIDNAIVGQLGVDNMKATVVEAINSYTGVAVIGEGKIGNLSADKITTGTISADRISGSVIDAVNANIGTATIDKAVIPNLDAAHIQSEVIKAINASIETATIDAAQIGQLGVDNLTTSVIQAINASLENATIGSAKIGTLSVDNMKANVLDAVNFHAQTGTLDEALIHSLNAGKINAGDIAAERMTTNAIAAINADISSATIDSAQIGALTADKIQASVISAINANIGTAKIDQAVIPELSSDHITASVISAINASIGEAKIDSAKIGTLNADVMSANIIQAINAKISTATIDQAVIPHLDADHIASSVVEAINLKATVAQIDQARIGNLDANKITAGDIAADRIKTNVVAAINADLSTATIGSAKIGSLKAENIQAEVVKAINASIETATINSAKIGTLSVDNLKAAVVQAINASIENATIDSAKIGVLAADKISTNVIEAINANVGVAHIDEGVINTLNADKIVGGSIDAAVLTSSVINAVNASIEGAVINNARIGVLDADHIKSSVIEAINANIGTAYIDKAVIPQLDADHIKASVIEAINAKITTATIDSAVIPNLDAAHIQSSVIDAINANIGTAYINQAVIPQLDAGHISASVIDAINTQVTGRAVINEANIGNLSATKITSGDIAAQRMTANAIAAINADITSATIDAAQIGSLTTDNLKAAVVDAVNLYTGTATINAAKVGTLDVANMSANIIKAVNASLETATINAAKIAALDADHIKAVVIDAINTTTQTAVIGQAKIGNLDATKITTGDIAAARMTTNAIAAINADLTSATIDSAQIGALTADKISASVIAAINANIGTAHIDQAIIPELDSDHIKASVINAINASVENITINSGKIGTLDADNMATNIITAINANIGLATIDKAVIPQLDATHIKATVIDAINTTTQTAVIGSAKIADLDAAKIVTGDITSDRLKANAIAAINANLTSATIDAAKIGSLTVGNMKAAAIDAVNAYVGTATINAAKIGALEVDNLKAAVIQAVNASVENATINSAMIGTLSADKMSTNVIAAVNANIGLAQIDKAIIPNLDASKITTGSIAANLMTTNVIQAINADLTTATIGAAKIGSLKAENIEAEVIKAINASVENATIGAAKIGALSVDNMKANVISAINGTLESAKISQAVIGNLDASKITTGSIAAGLLTANVVSAINADVQTAQINSAKIQDLNASKIVAGDIDAARMTANVVSAINTYTQNMTAGSAQINSAVIGTLSADHMQAKVISAINASIETINGTNAVINNAKIGTLTADHIKGAVVEAINLNATTAVIDQGKIGVLDATKITTGDIAAARMTTNAIAAINADITTATIDAAQIGALTAAHIEAEVIEAINTTTDTATINSAKIGDLTAGHIDAVVISAINASLESATINAARIGSLKAENIEAEVIKAINASVENITINNAKIAALDADHIKAVVIDAINTTTQTATIGAAKIGVLTAANIGAGTIDATKINVAGLRADQITSGYISTARLQAGSITSDLIGANQITTQHMQAGSIAGDRIEAGTLNADRLVAGTLDASFIKAGTITSELISAGAITARNIAANSITADMIQAGQITAEKISTKGLDAQVIQVYNGKTGQVLIGSGYLRVDGLDVGVVQSDNLVANGAFMTSSSGYGYLRDNPTGEAILGGKATSPGGHQLWKISLVDGTVFPIDLGGQKPVDVAIDANEQYAYVTIEGNNTLVQVDMANNMSTGTTLKMGKGPGRIYYSGGKLDDMKHFFVLNTDPEDMNVPDSLTIVDAPTTSIDQKLYVHHNVPLGSTPYDVVTNGMHQTFVTLAGQGDIVMLQMDNPNSMNWKPVKNIPISAYMTDNYHGGMTGEFGLNEATGGDASSQYNTGMQDMEMTGMDPHGGYGVTDGSMITYEPHGIDLSSDMDILYVADYANGYLIVVDINGKAPYNALTGSRQQGNIGSMGFPMGMGPNKPDNPPGTAPISDPSMGGMVMSVDEPEFVAMDMSMPGMDMGDTTVTTSGGRTFSKDQTQHTTHYVWYRIPVGDSPDFVKVANGKIFVTVEGTGKVAVIEEQQVLDNLTYDRWYYTNYDEFTVMHDLPTWTVNYIDVGSKPSHMHYNETTGQLFVTVNGQNQVVVIDTNNIDPMNPNMSIVNRINVGANPKGIRVDSAGEYMYVVNYGGAGDLSFVYPGGGYIGDPYIGLEGGVEYQGADGWAPMRSQWIENSDGDVVAAASVEFHINEPFLNEGGYVKLTAYNDGEDAQYAYIEQDLVNVTNYSNGNNTVHVTGEKLTPNSTYTWFMPANPWLNPPGVTNVKIKGIVKGETLVRQADNLTFNAANKWMATPQPPQFQKVLADGTVLAVDESSYTITYPTSDTGTAKVVFNSAIEAGANIIAIQYYWWKTATGYTVEYNTGAYIQFPLGTIPSDDSQWVEADYTAKYNMWFKPHNGSISVAQEQGSSDNFYTKFEIDEFVPKYITYDNQTTDPFVYSPIAVQGTNANYTGVQYSTMTNRSIGAGIATTASSIDLGVPSNPDLTPIISGTSIDAWDGDHTMEPIPAHTTVTLPGGLQSVTVDLGKVYMIGRISVGHSYGEDRVYHNTKTEVSEDGVTWTTIYDSAVSGEWNEKPTYHTVHGHTHYAKFFTFTNKRVRFIRDWANGWTSGDGLTSGTENNWTVINAYGDWEYDTSYVYPDSAPEAGESMATNGRGIVSTDIDGAYAAIDIAIDFTSKWFMTYLIGPDFGMAEVEMSSMMGMSHTLTMEAPTLSKFQHKHIMYWPPSANVKADAMNNVLAGHHRATIRQKSGRINIDTFRFEDYQYFDRNSQLITPDKSATFRRTKIVPTSAQWFVGDAIQSSEGAYNSPRLNPDTGLPDYSVAIKYRMRFRVDLAEGAQLPDGSKKPGRGIAYATSAIFETGKLSTHWRRSESSDKIPGTQIEAWDGNHPHKTGIQNFHLANAAVKGNKIAPLAIMDHHINPYAQIQESKLKLNYPTHRHGRPIMAEVMPGMMMEVGWVDNKPVLDTIEGWGGNGTANTMARGDHNHDDRYILKSGDGSVVSLTVTGDLTVGGLVDGVDVSVFKSSYDTHVADTVAHLSQAEHTKLTGISTGATKTQSSTTNGNIKIDGVETTVYTHPSTDGNLHVPATSTTHNGQFLKAGATAGSISWAQIAFTDISGTITATQHGNQTSGTLHANANSTTNGFMSYQDKNKLDGISTGANKVVDSTTNGNILIDGVDTNVYTHPTGDGNLHVPANGTTHANHVLKASSTAGVYSWAPVQWTEISGTFSDILHGNLSGGSLHAVATGSVNGFMSAADKLKLDAIQSNAINQTTADGRYVLKSGDTITGNLVIDNIKANSGIEIGDTGGVQETPYIDFHSSGNNIDYDARIVASGGDTVTGRGTLSVEAATFNVDGNITVTGTVDGVDVSGLAVSYASHTRVPNPASNFVLTESGTQVNVKFDLSDSTEVTEYEIWASFADNAHYEVVGIVNDSDIAPGVTTYTFVDDSYNRKGTIYYRVYAKNGSVRSSSLEGSIVLAHTVADPTNLNVVANIDSFDIFYTVPNDRLLDHIEIVIDKQDVEANLAESNGAVVYSGLADRFTYKIPSVDYDKFHNVWVRSVTRI
jgi:hypothetical protein